MTNCRSVAPSSSSSSSRSPSMPLSGRESAAARAETDLLRPRVHRPAAGRFAKVQVETDVGRAGLKWCRSTSGRTSLPLSMRTRAARRARLAADQSAPFSTRRRASERVGRVRERERERERTSERTRAQVTADRYIIFATGLRACLTVHRSRRPLNPTLFARCITYFVIAHFVRRANRHTGTSSFRNGLRALADDERASARHFFPPPRVREIRAGLAAPRNVKPSRRKSFVELT